MKGFMAFLMRGNVIDLAVAVVIGAAFGSVITALVKDLITPLISAVVSAPEFTRLAFELHGSRFMYGDFLNTIVSFILIAAVIYFIVVTPMNAIAERRKTGEVAPTTRACSECLNMIPVAARRCGFCTTTF